MLILIIPGHPLLKLVHALRQLSDELIKVSLLAIDLVLAATTACVVLQVFTLFVANAHI